MDTKKIVENIFAQAEKGEIAIGDEKSGIWSFYVKFCARINGQNRGGFDGAIIDIPNYDLFLKKTEDYLTKAKEFYYEDKDYFELSENSFEEKLFFDLIVNSNSFEQKNILSFIDKRKNMIKETLPCGEKFIGEFEGKRLYCKISKNHSNLESPYKMTFTFKSEEGEFVLPMVSFGKTGDYMEVFAVQNKKEKQTCVLAKKLDRYFRKLNSGVDMEDIIGNVSPNALASLALFSSLCEKGGVKEIVAPDFLPIRYNATLSAKGKLSEEVRGDALEKVDKDQFNITNKFMYLFLRYNFHFPSSIVDYDIDKGEMTLSLNGKEKNGKNIIYSLYDVPKVNVFKRENKEIVK